MDPYLGTRTDVVTTRKTNPFLDLIWEAVEQTFERLRTNSGGMAGDFRCRGL